MKRLLLALGIGAVVFGGVFGLAASFGVNTDSLGGGSTAVAACQTTPVQVSYAPNGADMDVTVDDFDLTSTPNCDGSEFVVRLTGTNSLDSSSSAQIVNAVSETVTVPNAAATDVTNVQLTVVG